MGWGGGGWAQWPLLVVIIIVFNANIFLSFLGGLELGGRAENSGLPPCKGHGTLRYSLLEVVMLCMR